MATQEVLADFNAALNPQEAVEGEAETAVDPAAAKVEELELMIGGKPMRLPLNAEIPVKHNGQILKTPLEKLLNGYRQGAHLDDKMKEYQALKAQMEAEKGDVTKWQALKSKYETIDQWSEQNPDKWQRLWDMFEKREQALTTQAEDGSASPAMLQELTALRNELKELKAWKDERSKAEEEAAIEEEMGVITQEVEEFAKKWPEIDLNEKDLDGITLKSRIMHFGAQERFPKFASAAREYLNDRLLDTVAQRARNEAVKGVQKEKQQGIVSRSSTPQGQGAEVDPLKLSKSDRVKAAKADFENLLAGS